MDLEFEIEGIKVEAKIDTGFDGEIIVNKDVFDRIPYYPSEGPRVCTASLECYSTYVKLAKVRYMGREVVAKVLNSPAIEKNIVGEELLRKLGGVINYKSNKIEDP
ncbi:clan AA aspartic protease [Metallosphaera hakonensis]|uniref:Clan AA aspartic protease n=1 Tax=Metallosphaera hakonensis JCM 8857 = DSM 7519 TaxID=1293036 RepID=A0A2U9IX59_9CREN|nr:clan AA aspartic protease [Metallosphaera hakonensis]AWS00448.1 clan AA aspartic protease [Metallosphaera hakonensis JCM 8857 = DSM 7519]